MDYEKKYKDALARAKELCDVADTFTVTIHDIITIFPELKESKDDRIVRCLLNYFNQVRYDGLDLKGTDIDEVIAWLEKQGEQNSVEWSEEDGKIHDMTYNPTDNVEPKFHPGDWVILNGIVAKILDKQKYGFVGLDIDGKDFFCNYGHTDSMRLWTIEDAKDGDVLVHNGYPFIFMGVKDGIVQALEENLLEGTNPVNFGEPKIDKDYQPATKEQRDVLFSKMKELKKIKVKTLNADKVIAWLVANICDFEHYVKLFKKDFGL